jgi:hypothetical protein
MRKITEQELKEQTESLPLRKKASEYGLKLANTWRDFGKITSKEYAAFRYIMEFTVREENGARFTVMDSEDVKKHTGLEWDEFLAMIDSVVYKGLLPENPLRSIGA